MSESNLYLISSGIQRFCDSTYEKNARSLVGTIVPRDTNERKCFDCVECTDSCRVSVVQSVGCMTKATD